MNGATRIHDWAKWLTDVRLARWNHLRSRAGEEPIDRESAARYLSEVARQARYDREARVALEEIKARIAE